LGNERVAAIDSWRSCRPVVKGIPEAAREAVLARVIADLTNPTTRIPE
jgi:hypothetical protein